MVPLPTLLTHTGCFNGASVKNVNYDLSFYFPLHSSYFNCGHQLKICLCLCLKATSVLFSLSRELTMSVTTNLQWLPIAYILMSYHGMWRSSWLGLKSLPVLVHHSPPVSHACTTCKSWGSSRSPSMLSNFNVSSLTLLKPVESLLLVRSSTQMPPSIPASKPPYNILLPFDSIEFWFYLWLKLYLLSSVCLFFLLTSLYLEVEGGWGGRVVPYSQDRCSIKIYLGKCMR